MEAAPEKGKGGRVWESLKWKGTDAVKIRVCIGVEFKVRRSVVLLIVVSDDVCALYFNVSLIFYLFLYSHLCQVQIFYLRRSEDSDLIHVMCGMEELCIKIL